MAGVEEQGWSGGGAGFMEGAIATSHVGVYTLYETIGEGAFGKVKIAVHGQTRERVAVKIMDKGEIRQQDFTSQVRREIYIMRHLKHKHIVKMHEVLSSDTKLYIVMELVTGGELFDRIEHGRVPEHLARQYFQQLVDGVDFCHKKGVAHRDLKPENLLVDESGDIKITDFGFSSMKGRDVNAGLLYTQCGTPDYCAPEIIDSARDGYNGAKVDAWSCGIILFALLCGRLPFQEHDAEKLYDLILACQVRYPPHIPADARDLLEHLLVRDPTRRYDLQKVKRHPWFLVNYDGDDAKLLKKRPFYNKNHKELAQEGMAAPSSPVIAQADGAYSLRPLARPRTPASPLSDPMYSAPLPAPPVTATLACHDSVAGSISDAAGVDTGATLDRQDVARNSQDNLQPLANFAVAKLLCDDAYGSSNGGATAVAAGGLITAAAGNATPASPANEIDLHMRAPTPPTHAVFTRVEDRPATPARRQASLAFKAAAAAAAAHEGMGGYGGAALSPTSATRRVNANTGMAVGYPPVGANGGVGTAFQMGGSGSLTYAEARVGMGADNAGLDIDVEGEEDDSSSEQGSIEDYEESGPLQLELPLNTEAYRAGSLPAGVARHSDRESSLVRGVDVESGPASLSALPVRHTYARDSRNSGSLGDTMRGVRGSLGGRASKIPSLPFVGQTTGSTNTLAYEQFRTISPGVGNGMQASAPAESPAANQGAAHTSAGMYWQTQNAEGSTENVAGLRAGTGAGIGGGAAAAGNGSGGVSTFQGEIFSRLLWSMVTKYRGGDGPVPAAVAKDILRDIHMMRAEMGRMSRNEDIASVFFGFLSMLEANVGSDTSAMTQSPGHATNRSRGTSDLDDYDDGTTVGSRDDLQSSSQVRYGMSRRTATDMSSEEEPLSWSPVLADSNRYESDLARRRNDSDLLNRWIKKTGVGGPSTSTDAVERPTQSGDEEEPTSTADLKELQRLMREHHGGRESSNIADDLLELMDKNQGSVGNETPFGTGFNHAGQSAPPVQSSRSADHYAIRKALGSTPAGVANGRLHTPLRSESGGNVPLPSEYVPRRFQEPNSLPGRGCNGLNRLSAFAGRGRSSLGVEEGNTLTEQQRRDNMATSMGMHDVAYYESDRKNGMATKLRGVLQTMKAKNQKLGERHAQFQTPLPPDMIMRLLGRILKDMGAQVTIKKETKRKMKCRLPLKMGSMLFAGIELSPWENDVTCVAFRRSRLDKGRTDTDSFHTFFEQVRIRFTEEAKSLDLRPRKSPTKGNAAPSSGRTLVKIPE